MEMGIFGVYGKMTPFIDFTLCSYLLAFCDLIKENISIFMNEY